MTEPKFTQGPWKRVYDDYNEEYVIMDSSGEFAITYVHDWGDSPIIGDCPIEANARLIEAAPDMYAALKEAMRFIPTDYDDQLLARGMINELLERIDGKDINVPSGEESK